MKYPKFGFSTLFLITTLALSTNPISAQQKFQPNWPSLGAHTEVPDWIRDAKSGIYCHWGMYAVPAYNNEHYIQHMHNDSPDYSKLGTYKRHLALYGPLEKFDYHDFIPQFKGENFNADEWADLFGRGGAKFAGPVADVIYHDAWLEQVPAKNVQTYLAHYFNEADKRKQDVIVTYKGEDLPVEVGMEDHENSNPDKRAGR